MASFRENNNSPKSLIALKGFALSFLFLAVFVLGYMLSADLVARLFPHETGGFLAVWGPPMLIALACSLLCCALMLVLQDKVIVPSAFVFLAVYYLILLLCAYLKGENELHIAGIQMINIYALPPVLLGNLLSWGIYSAHRFKKQLHNEL